MEHAVVKTVCALLNSEGGSLLIGIGDDGQAIGLGHDFATLSAKPNTDGFELFLHQLLDHYLSVVTANTVRILFHGLQDKLICEVAAAASGRPVFARPPKGNGSDSSEFWVRIGNATRQLHGDEMVQYQREHWG